MAAKGDSLSGNLPERLSETTNGDVPSEAVGMKLGNNGHEQWTVAAKSTGRIARPQSAPDFSLLLTIAF